MSIFLRHGRWSLASLLLAVVLLAASGAAGERVEAAIGTFEVAMVGANEVPAASGPGSGLARFTFNDVTRELTYVVWMRGLSSGEVTASHIHRAPAGTARAPLGAPAPPAWPRRPAARASSDTASRYWRSGSQPSS